MITGLSHNSTDALMSRRLVPHAELIEPLMLALERGPTEPLPELGAMAGTILLRGQWSFYAGRAAWACDARGGLILVDQGLTSWRHVLEDLLGVESATREAACVTRALQDYIRRHGAPVSDYQAS